MATTAQNLKGMAFPPPIQSGNAALAALSFAAFSLLEPHLRHRDLPKGFALWDAGEADRVYFPLSGIVSVGVPVGDGDGIEVATIGREGAACVGYTLAWRGAGEAQPLSRGIVQIAGAFALIPATQFASAARINEEIDQLAAFSCDWVLVQSQQMAACNAAHPADARLCRWLLQTSDRIEGALIPSTQEAIAHALGVRRTSVTEIAHDLKRAGIIAYKRGKIVIRDHARLRDAACDCHATLGRSHWPCERLAGIGAGRPSVTPGRLISDRTLRRRICPALGSPTQQKWLDP
jgi:Crp-like helix-turn-helix domain